MANIFISGISSGIGRALALRYADQGHMVYGLSRRTPDFTHEHIRHRRVDLARLAAIGPEMAALLDGAGRIELAILGAGAPGRIARMAHASIDELKAVMDVNLWAQKEMLDALMAGGPPARVVALSSGASVHAAVGWSGYALSKCALNMLVQLYASEYPRTHFVALAPGLVATAMQDYVFNEVSAAEFPSVAPLHAARGTAAMPDPGQFACAFEQAFARLCDVPSGAYVDLRDLAGPAPARAPAR